MTGIVMIKTRRYILGLGARARKNAGGTLMKTASARQWMIQKHGTKTMTETDMATQKNLNPPATHKRVG